MPAPPSLITRGSAAVDSRRTAMALHPAYTNGLGVDLVDIASGLAAVARDLRLDDGDATRRFARVLSTAQYDAWVIRWMSSADLRLHDHGDSFGVVQVVDGELVELRADANQPGRARSRTVRRGETIRITPATIHAVSNTASTEALSVHVYSPPLSAMTFYDARNGRLVPSTRNVVGHEDGPA